MAVRTVTYTAHAASAIDAAILQAVATVLDVDLKVSQDGAKSSSSTLEICYFNAFSNEDTKLRAVSLTGCVRLLTARTELELTPEMESWLYATEQTVLPSVRLGE